MLEFPCIYCGQTVTADESQMGGKAQCPACHASVLVPVTHHRPSTPPPPIPIVPPPLPPPVQTRGSGRSVATVVGIVLLALVALAVLGNLMPRGGSGGFRTSREREEEKRISRQMAQDMKRLAKETRDADGLPKETQFRLKTGGPATTDGERVREVVNGFMNDMVDLQTKYMKGLDAIGLVTLLDASRLAKDVTNEESDRILAEARKLAETAKADGLKLMADMPKRLDAHPFSEAFKRDFLRGYEAGRKTSLKKFNENWALELSTLALLQQVCTHLHATRGKWEFQDEQFVFETEADTLKFQGYMDEIDRNTQKQTEMSQGSLDQAIKRLED